jgi:hypothetical protein
MVDGSSDRSCVIIAPPDGNIRQSLHLVHKELCISIFVGHNAKVQASKRNVRRFIAKVFGSLPDKFSKGRESKIVDLQKILLVDGSNLPVVVVERIVG